MTLSTRARHGTPECKKVKEFDGVFAGASGLAQALSFFERWNGR